MGNCNYTLFSSIFSNSFKISRKKFFLRSAKFSLPCRQEIARDRERERERDQRDMSRGSMRQDMMYPFGHGGDRDRGDRGDRDRGDRGGRGGRDRRNPPPKIIRIEQVGGT